MGFGASRFWLQPQELEGSPLKRGGLRDLLERLAPTSPYPANAAALGGERRQKRVEAVDFVPIFGAARGLLRLRRYRGPGRSDRVAGQTGGWQRFVREE